MRRSYIRGAAAGYIAPSARLYPCFARVMFCALRAKRKGVCAVRTHFEGAVPQNNAECGIAHSVNSVRGAGAPSPPSEGFGFRAPPVADTARKASRCRPQVRERIAEARAENGEGAKVDACIKDLSRQTEGEIHRVCAKALDIDKGKSK